MSVGESLRSIRRIFPPKFVTLTPSRLVDFSNILTKATIERLAEVDEYEVVREVQVSGWLATS